MPDQRKNARAVRRYLEALERHKPKRGRRRTPESITKRLETIDAKLDEAPPLQRLQLTQERIDLTKELIALQDTADLSALEDAFVAAAKEYSEAKGITYSAYRELGVPAEVLRRAGIKQTRQRT